MSKSKPLSFSPAMILALRDGSKTMTRRLLPKSGKPRFKAGDTIWVKEGWINVICYQEAGTWLCDPSEFDPKEGDALAYKADHPNTTWKFRNSRYMPKWASRITLVVTESRVERLQDISGEDAIREGVPCAKWSEDDWIDSDGYPTSYERRMEQAFEEFTELWDSIHGPGSWDKNPEVEVISFEVQK